MDKTLAEFSTLNLGTLVYAMSKQKQPNLDLKSWTKPLLGYFPIDLALPKEPRQVQLLLVTVIVAGTLASGTTLLVVIY